VKYAAIADWAADKEYSVTFMCDQLGVARSDYYRWLADGPCQREAAGSGRAEGGVGVVERRDVDRGMSAFTATR
jgi:hypothetical protein